MEIVGIIEAIKINQINTVAGPSESFNVLLNKTWFNGFDKYEVSKGDNVKIEYTENGKYKNINNIDRIETNTKVESVNSNVQTQIIRQNCLSHSTKIVLEKYNLDDVESIVDKIIEVSTKLEEYVSS